MNVYWNITSRFIQHGINNYQKFCYCVHRTSTFMYQMYIMLARLIQNVQSNLLVLWTHEIILMANFHLIIK